MFCSRWHPDANDCQDVLQQVAVVVVRKFHEFDRSRSFNAWTIGIAKQEVLAMWRRRRTDRLVFSDAMVDRIAEAYQCILADTASDAADALEICLQKLQGRARTVIGLHYSDGMKTVAIAEKLEMEHTAVRMLLSRARKVLRECIERRLGRSLTKP
jgi:RNA polymerase sigma-70 factor (ECF subfamily)